MKNRKKILLQNVSKNPFTTNTREGITIIINNHTEYNVFEEKNNLNDYVVRCFDITLIVDCAGDRVVCVCT